ASSEGRNFSSVSRSRFRKFMNPPAAICGTEESYTLIDVTAQFFLDVIDKLTSVCIDCTLTTNITRRETTENRHAIGYFARPHPPPTRAIAARRPLLHVPQRRQRSGEPLLRP